MSCTYLLSSVITELCERAGLAADKIDVSRLDQEVRGFSVVNAYPANEAIRALSRIFLFDMANYDGIVHFVPRGDDTVATVTEDDLVLDDQDFEQAKRSDAISIPRVLHLSYHDVLGGIAPDKQTSERAGLRRATGEVSVQTPVLMSADEAAEVIVVSHAVMIESQSGELKIELPDSFLQLTVSDPVFFQHEGKTERLLVQRIDILDGQQQYTLVRDRQSAYTADVEGFPASIPTPPPSSIVGPTAIVPLDIHILRDADDQLGYYVGISGLLPAWQGATVELSLDGGENYIESLDWTSAAIIGETLDSLGDHPQAFPDEINDVTVRLYTPLAELFDVDLEGLLNRQNLAIIGDEILQFGQADETTSGDWQLSHFIRGRRNTDSQPHGVGERFVLLNRAVLAFIPANLPDLGRTLTFRATSFGETQDTAQVVSMLFEGQSQTEAQPAYLRVHRSGSDAVISWQGVGRIGFGASVAQGQYFIEYHVTLDDGSLVDNRVTIAQTLTVDVSSFTPPISISVQQRNQFTGLGPAIEVILS